MTGPSRAGDGARAGIPFDPSRDARRSTIVRIERHGVEVVSSVYRLLRMLHARQGDRAAVAAAAELAASVVDELAQRTSKTVRLSWIDDEVRVCGRLLRGDAAAWDRARRLGSACEICGVAELAFEGGITADEIMRFASALSAGVRNSRERSALFEASSHQWPHVAVVARESGPDPIDVGGRRRAMRTVDVFAAAVVAMRWSFEAFAAGEPAPPAHVKRIAQRLVESTERPNPVLVALALAPGAPERGQMGPGDAYSGIVDGHRAVRAAILAVLAARGLTREPEALVLLAHAALQCEVGRVRWKGVRAGGESAADDARLVPAMAAAGCLADGRFDAATAARAAAAFETTWLEMGEVLGSIHAGELPAAWIASLLRVVRAVVDRVCPAGAQSPSAGADALLWAAERTDFDPEAVALLLEATGLLPAGTVVEFQTGEWAVITAPSRAPSAVDRPRVALVTNGVGQVYDPPQTVDLGAPDAGRSYPSIARVVPPASARFNALDVVVRCADE